MNFLYQNCKIGKGAEAIIDGITTFNQCDMFEQEFGDIKCNYLLEFVESKMIGH